ncbi:17131_t:CDS:2 [Cetraspora pellucida]|uniref:17131_t:CDS:1 n=1 Tax=Cetraspora pellucida TaxID=1433469 RepID=A0ACA9K185_9GLOM|nr:17131_t:CDS:2 [Cetraspora pellucida]
MSYNNGSHLPNENQMETDSIGDSHEKTQEYTQSLNNKRTQEKSQEYTRSLNDEPNIGEQSQPQEQHQQIYYPIETKHNLDEDQNISGPSQSHEPTETKHEQFEQNGSQQDAYSLEQISPDSAEKNVQANYSDSTKLSTVNDSQSNKVSSPVSDETQDNTVTTVVDQRSYSPSNIETISQSVTYQQQQDSSKISHTQFSVISDVNDTVSRSVSPQNLNTTIPLQNISSVPHQNTKYSSPLHPVVAHPLNTQSQVYFTSPSNMQPYNMSSSSGSSNYYQKTLRQSYNASSASWAYKELPPLPSQTDQNSSDPSSTQIQIDNNKQPTVDVSNSSQHERSIIQIKSLKQIWSMPLFSDGRADIPSADSFALSLLNVKLESSFLPLSEPS